MPFKMQFDKTEMEGIKPVEPGIYTVAFIKFKPKKSKNAEKPSINLNAQAKILGIDEVDGKPRFLFANLNSSIPSFIQDFVHSFGLEMTDQFGENPGIPGEFDGKEDDPTTWVYQGPLIGQTAQWEVTVSPHWQDSNKQQQDIVRFICKVPDCANRFPHVKHSTDMRKKG